MKFISNYLLLIWKYYIVLQAYFLFRILMTFFFITSETFQPICYILEYKVLCQTNLYEETITKWNWNHILRRGYVVAFELWINRNEFENLFGKSSSVFFNENKWVLMLPPEGLIFGGDDSLRKSVRAHNYNDKKLIKKIFLFHSQKCYCVHTPIHAWMILRKRKRSNVSPKLKSFHCI